MDSIMENEQTENPQAEPDQQTEPEVQAGQGEGQVVSESEFAAGGKDFGSLEDLRNAYSELQKGFTQKSQEYSEYKTSTDRYKQAMEEIRQDPELVRQIQSYLSGQQARQNFQVPGQTQYGTQSALNNGLNSEDDSRLAKMELQFETQALQRSHPELTDANITEIYQLATDLSQKLNADIPLEHVFTQWAWKSKGADLYQKGLNDKEAEIRKARGASTTQPVVGGEKVRSKFNSNAPGGERRAHIDQLLRDQKIDMSGFD